MKPVNAALADENASHLIGYGLARFHTLFGKVMSQRGEFETDRLLSLVDDAQEITSLLRTAIGLEEQREQRRR